MMSKKADIAAFVRSLSQRADEESETPIDVRARVLASVADAAAIEVRQSVDVVPLAFSGVAVTVAAAVVVLLLPAWQTVSEPWVAYLP